MSAASIIGGTSSIGADGGAGRPPPSEPPRPAAAALRARLRLGPVVAQPMDSVLAGDDERRALLAAVQSAEARDLERVLRGRAQAGSPVAGWRGARGPWRHSDGLTPAGGRGRSTVWFRPP